MKTEAYSRLRVEREDLNANGPSTCGVLLGINAHPKRKMWEKSHQRWPL
jgi:hypothetical protein